MAYLPLYRGKDAITKNFGTQNQVTNFVITAYLPLYRGKDAMIFAYLSRYRGRYAIVSFSKEKEFCQPISLPN